MEIEHEIEKLAKQKNALILAHNYQPAEIQFLAHYTGDSLELAQIAADNDADIIVLCGVYFMAESAAILSPEKKVLLPEWSAGCPLADMAKGEDLIKMKEKYPDAKVVTYINSSAEIKSLSDVCCTSSNAVKIIQNTDAARIIFVPDRNLGSYVQRFTDKELILWPGYCPCHNDFTASDLKEIKDQHPDAVVIVHPECRAEVIDMADEVLSTGGMVKFVESTEYKKIIVGTEKDMIVKLRSISPDKEYIHGGGSLYCEEMKKITLQKLYDSLLNEAPVVTVPDNVASRAYESLRRMLDLSK